MPSSSARCAPFPRVQDKVHYYIKPKDLRDQLKGIAPNMEVQEVQYAFDLQLAQEDAKKMAVKEEQYDPGYEAVYGGACCDQAPCESKPCCFSSNGTAKVQYLGRSACKPLVLVEKQRKDGKLSDPQYHEGLSFSEVPNGQWMTQSFAEQIPEFSAGLTGEEEGSGA